MASDGRITRAIHRVLVIFPGALGDFICLMPAIGAISRRHPGASIELMARFELARLAVGRTVVARGHSIDAREVSELFTDEPSDRARRFFCDFDRIYSFLASNDARFRANLNAATNGDVSFHPFRPAGDGHVSEAYLSAIGEGGLLERPLLEPTASDLTAAEHALTQSRCDRPNLIVIFPGSGSPAKNWPPEKFAALASMLSNQASFAAVLGPAEKEIEPVFRDAGLRMVKDLDLPTVAGIARIASAFVGNDSGVSHLAAAVGTYGLAIFGPTDPARWRPMAASCGQRVEIFRREPIESIEPRELANVLIKICRRASNIIDC